MSFPLLLLKKSMASNFVAFLNKKRLLRNLSTLQKPQRSQAFAGLVFRLPGFLVLICQLPQKHFQKRLWPAIPWGIQSGPGRILTLLRTQMIKGQQWTCLRSSGWGMCEAHQGTLRWRLIRFCEMGGTSMGDRLCLPCDEQKENLEHKANGKSSTNSETESTVFLGE